MTIAQALKEKNKKVAKIQKLWHRLSMYNVWDESEVRPYDLVKTYQEWEKEINSLISLKHAIHAASQPVRKEIFELSELKHRAQLLKSLDTNPVAHLRSRFSSEERPKLNVVLDVAWQDQQIESLEARIEAIQELLDKHNHSTQIF